MIFILYAKLYLFYQVFFIEFFIYLICKTDHENASVVFLLICQKFMSKYLFNISTYVSLIIQYSQMKQHNFLKFFNGFLDKLIL